MIIRPHRFASAPPGSGDPYWNNVVSLLHFDGVDASTTFTDERGAIWTSASGAKLSTSNKKFGTASGLFNSAARITTPDAAGTAFVNFETDDYTIEAWVMPTSAASYACIAAKRANGGTYAAFEMRLQALKLTCMTTNGTSWYQIAPSSASLSTSEFTHIAMVRQGSTISQYIGGAAAGSLTIPTLTQSAAAKSSPISIGAIGDGTEYWTGYIDEFRFTSGVGRYTTNFTPPTAPFPNHA